MSKYLDFYHRQSMSYLYEKLLFYSVSIVQRSDARDGRPPARHISTYSGLTEPLLLSRMASGISFLLHSRLYILRRCPIC